VTASDPQEDKRLIQEAVKVAMHADVVVLAIGGNEQTSREGWSRNHLGDRATLDLVGRQELLIKSVVATGTPVIALLFNGSPIANTCLVQSVPVIFECWYLGQECGAAIADVLFGDYNPGGKLPITIPRSAGHLPAFYNHKPSARRGYLFDDVSPLFAFGYGLSYTKFSFSHVRLKSKRISRREQTQALVDVKNTGKRAGTEVVQMYIRDCVSSVTRPVKELKGFKKVTLKPGEKKTVALDITSESLAFYDINMKYVVEPGEFEIMVGNSSRDQDLQKVVLTVD
jgi:beta-glucosidase